MDDKELHITINAIDSVDIVNSFDRSEIVKALVMATARLGAETFVGEKGPELFIPSPNSRIISNEDRFDYAMKLLK